jgi:ribonuclease G
MKKDIIINSTANEHRIAILEDGKLAELFVDVPGKDRNVGDIYLGRVAKVMPGIRAAFIDIGHEQDAFLHFSDIGAIEELNSLFEEDDEDEDSKKDSVQPPAAPADAQHPLDTPAVQTDTSVETPVSPLSSSKPERSESSKRAGYPCPDYKRTGREKGSSCSICHISAGQASRAHSVRRQGRCFKKSFQF